MNAFDIAAILITLGAVFGYINYRLLRLPSTVGILRIALVSSLIILATDRIMPGWHLQSTLSGFLVEIDFNTALMHGMLCFLLFAGALHVELEDLLANRWTIGLLATLGVGISTALVGGLTYGLFRMIGLEVPLLICLVFGALISPNSMVSKASICIICIIACLLFRGSRCRYSRCLSRLRSDLRFSARPLLPVWTDVRFFVSA